MAKKSKARTGRFAGHVDTTLVGAVGHSAGGARRPGAVGRADRRVTTFVGLAGAAGRSARAKRAARSRAAIMAGTTDGIISPEPDHRGVREAPQAEAAASSWAAATTRSATCARSAPRRAGCSQVAELLHFPVSDDLRRLASRRLRAAVAPADARPGPRSARPTVAHLRHVFGFDRSTKGLRGLKAALPGRGRRSSRGAASRRPVRHPTGGSLRIPA